MFVYTDVCDAIKQSLYMYTQVEYINAREYPIKYLIYSKACFQYAYLLFTYCSRMECRYRHNFFFIFSSFNFCELVPFFYCISLKKSIHRLYTVHIMYMCSSCDSSMLCVLVKESRMFMVCYTYTRIVAGHFNSGGLMILNSNEYICVQKKKNSYQTYAWITAFRKSVKDFDVSDLYRLLYFKISEPHLSLKKEN